MVAIIKHPSANFNDRADGEVPDMLLLHYTGMKTGAEALARMCDARAKVAAHYMVEEDGTVYQLVAEDKRAWHAGVASWGGMHDINGCSIGVEVVNPGHAFGYRDFPDVQMAALAALAQDIVARHAIKPTRVLGHSDVAPLRKQDPGERFNWACLARVGVGVGVGVLPKNIKKTAEDTLAQGAESQQVTVLQQQLVEIGYNLAITGHYDGDTVAVVTAFQRHWRQASVTGVADPETQDMLLALLSIWRAK